MSGRTKSNPARAIVGTQLGPPLSNQEGKMKEYGIKVDHKFTPEFSAYGSLAHYDMSLTHVRTFGVLPEGVPAGSIGIIESAADMAQGWELEYGLLQRLDPLDPGKSSLGFHLRARLFKF